MFNNKFKIDVADLFSGFYVSMLALPLCLGISIASGFPPIAGLFTAILGGIICSVIGGAPLTIKGPAAGLIVVVLGAVQELQTEGDPFSGYKRALAVGVVAGLVQIIFSRMKFGRLVEMIPHSVIHGMLASIGVIIISKQIHLLFGVKPMSNLSTVSLLMLIPDSIKNMNPEIFLLGLFSLFIMVGSPVLNRYRVFKYLPIPLLIVVTSVVISYWIDLINDHEYQIVGHIFHLGKEQLIKIPDRITSSIIFPDWSKILTPVSFKYVAMFALVGSIESLLTVSATESLKQTQEKVDHDKDLLAIGVANTLVSFIGGLPMISEVARSKANIDSGAKGGMSNLFHGLFLVTYIVFLPKLLAYIPLSTLAGMLIYVGTRLASINEFKHAWRIGPEQFLFFFTTFVLTITTDLLIGVFGGLLVAVFVTIVSSKSLKSLFKLQNQTSEEVDKFVVKLTGSATFLNSYQIRNMIINAENSSKNLVFDFSRAKFVEHTFIKKLNHNKKKNKNVNIEVKGLSSMKPFSKDPECSRKSIIK